MEGPSGRGRAGASSPVGTPLTPGFMHDSRILAVGWCLLIAFRPQPRNRLGLKLLSSCRMREAPPGRGRAGPSSPVGHPHPPSIDARSTLSYGAPGAARRSLFWLSLLARQRTIDKLHDERDDELLTSAMTSATTRDQQARAMTSSMTSD